MIQHCLLSQRLLPRCLRRCTALCAALGLAGAAAAQAMVLDNDSGLIRRDAQVRVSAERVKLPGNERMGLVGTSYLIELGQGLVAGPAAYGAISGQRGGLFTIGAEIGWRRQLVGPLSLDLGFYAGGGGGGAAPVGGGLMLRPHADLLWNLGGQRVGVSLAQVRFANGSINSRQLGLVWSADKDFSYVGVDHAGGRVDGGGRYGIGFDRMQAVVGVYRPRGNAKRVSGGALPRSIGFVGARFETPLGPDWYGGIEAAGAASGGVAGYAEYLGTVGAEARFFGSLVTLGARAALGMGGGGDIDTGGGLLAKASVYSIVRFTELLGWTLEAGLTRAPQGSFNALQASTSLVWVLDDPTARGDAQVTRTEWVGGVEGYNAVRRDGSTRALQAVALRVNRFVSPALYLTGQAHSAYGGGAGGYSVGLFGLGWQQSFGDYWRLGVEALAGAAGGGGVNTQGGFIVQPGVYVQRALTPGIAVRVGAGHVKGLRGPLAGNVIEASLTFTHGVLSHGDW